MKTIQKSVPVQTVLFLLMDAIFIIVAGGLALLVRFDFDFDLAVAPVERDDFVDKRELVILELLFDVFLYCLGVFA